MKNWIKYFENIEDDWDDEEEEVGDIKWAKISDIGEYDFAFSHDKRIMMYYNKIK